MTFKYTIRKPNGEVVKEDQFDPTDTVQTYDFLKRAERAIMDDYVVTVVKG